VNCGLLNSHFYGECFVGKNCVITDCSMIANVYIDESAFVYSCDKIVSSHADERKSGFPRTFEILLGSETYGRPVAVTMQDDFVDICSRFLNPRALKDKTAVSTVIDPLPGEISHLAHIGKKATVIKSRVENCYLGPAVAVDSSTIRNSLVASLASAPSRIVDGVLMESCLVHGNCVVERGAVIESVVLCECAGIGEKARVHHSVIGPDASLAGGECHHSVLGPFSGFHHESLLIATFWPCGRGNIAYGARVGANHTGRVNDQECWVGEGCFFGLGSTLKFPVNLVESPYSMIAPCTIVSPQCVRFPFSLVLPPGNELKLPVDVCLIKPGWVLTGNAYMLERLVDWVFYHLNRLC
jgi:carbonic anhydrase/acetyltransferase-like protein (isoleucine patch superfamily)